jgi:hypothetical protein
MLMRPIILFFLATILSTSTTAFAADVVNIKIVSRGDDNAKYSIAMLNLGLEKAGKPFKIDISNDVLSPQKLLEELMAGNIDVIWMGTSIEIEKQAIPVRVPIFKGLSGHRILIVHKDNEHLFDKVTTLEQALAFTYGQGKTWSDTPILEANGLKIVPAIKYEGLFFMADGKRFDAFPRGVHEPWGELTKRPELDLVVDSNIMFVYPKPYYLIVTPKRPELAAEIERGLLLAIDDGSFDQLFFNNEMVKTALQFAKLKNRRIFKLTNPEISPQTPLDNPKLWVDLETFDEEHVVY